MSAGRDLTGFGSEEEANVRLAVFTHPGQHIWTRSGTQYLVNPPRFALSIALSRFGTGDEDAALRQLGSSLKSASASS